MQLLHPSSSSSSPSTDPTHPSSSSLLPPLASDYLSPSTALHPYFLSCLTCSRPLSDCLHVVDGDDETVTVNALYQAVSIPSELEVSPSVGAFYPVHCVTCQSVVGRYFRFTGPQQMNRCNMFELRCSALQVQLLGKASIRGEDYATETGMATRLTQLLLSHEAMREELRQLRSLVTQLQPSAPASDHTPHTKPARAAGKRKREGEEEEAQPKGGPRPPTASAAAPSRRRREEVGDASGEDSEVDSTLQRRGGATMAATAQEAAYEENGEDGQQAGRGAKRGGVRGRGSAGKGQPRASTARGRPRGRPR